MKLSPVPGVLALGAFFAVLSCANPAEAPKAADAKPLTFLRSVGSEGGGPGQFRMPYSAQSDHHGHFYVADTVNHRIQLLDSDGTQLDEWGTGGAADGQFDLAMGLTVSQAGQVYVVDMSLDRVQSFTSSGGFVKKWGSTGSAAGQLANPYDLVVAGNEKVYVADYDNHRVQIFTATGSLLGSFGTLGVGDGQFDGAWGITSDPRGPVPVAAGGRRQPAGAVPVSVGVGLRSRRQPLRGRRGKPPGAGLPARRHLRGPGGK